MLFKRNIRVGDNLTGKTLYLSFPADLWKRLSSDFQDAFITGDLAGGSMAQRLTTDNGLKINRRSSITLETLYEVDSTTHEIITNLSSYIMDSMAGSPSDFGVVTGIDTSNPAYPYIKIEVDLTPTDESYFTFNSATGQITDYSASGPKDVVIPSTIGGVSVVDLGPQVFQSMALTSVYIPSSVTKIQHYTFFGNNLTEIDIPSSVKYIGPEAFNDNQFPDESAYIPYIEINSGTVYRNMANNYAGAKRSGIIIPDYITEIYNRCFMDCSITSVTIPSSVTIVGTSSFTSCNLTTLDIPDSVTTIGSTIVEYNDNFTSINIGSGITTIATNAFGGYYVNVTNIYIDRPRAYVSTMSGYSTLWGATSAVLKCSDELTQPGIRIGSTKCSKIVLGNISNIIKVYLGSTLLVDLSPTPTYPERVLVCSGTQYIDTGIKSQNDLKIEMKLNGVSNVDQCVFGGRNAGTSATFTLWYLTGTNFRWDYNNETTKNYATTFVKTQPYIIIKDANLNYIDDVLVQTNNSATFTSSYNLCLFTVNSGGTVDSRMARVKLYYCKLWDGGVLIRDYIPVQTGDVCDGNTATANGLYDKVSQTYFYNSGTGTFSIESV